MSMKELAAHVARRSGTKKSPRKGFTAALLAARADGRVIVASMGPVGMQNEPVAYSPRSKNDPQPWVATFGRKDGDGDVAYRLSGRECHAVDACGIKMIQISTGNYSFCGKPQGHTLAHHPKAV